MITVKNLEIENPNFTNPPTEITLETPLTILAGANGSGKSTLMTSIKNAVKKSYKNKTNRYHFNDVYDFDPTDGLNKILDLVNPKKSWDKPNAIIAEFDGYSTNDFHHMLGVAMSVGHMSINRLKYSEGQLRLIDTKRFFNLIHEAHNSDPSIPFFIFLDAVDSGLSPDLAYQLRQMIINFVKSHKNIYILTTANTFELLNSYQFTSISKDVTIIDVNTQKSINELINEYKDYFDYCSLHSTFDERVVDAESIIYK